MKTALEYACLAQLKTDSPRAVEAYKIVLENELSLHGRALLDLFSDAIAAARAAGFDDALAERRNRPLVYGEVIVTVANYENALSEAYRKGRADERERCAKVARDVERMSNGLTITVMVDEKKSQAATAKYIADAIEALPAPGSEGGR